MKLGDEPQLSEEKTAAGALSILVTIMLVILVLSRVL
jgi:hypothetical protein